MAEKRGLYKGINDPISYQNNNYKRIIKIHRNILNHFLNEEIIQLRRVKIDLHSKKPKRRSVVVSRQISKTITIQGRLSSYNCRVVLTSHFILSLVTSNWLVYFRSPMNTELMHKRSENNKENGFQKIFLVKKKKTKLSTKYLINFRGSSKKASLI